MKIRIKRLKNLAAKNYPRRKSLKTVMNKIKPLDKQ